MEHGTLTRELLKKMNNGSDNFQRRTLSINSCVKNDDGTYTFIGTRRLHGSVRDTKSKTDNVRRQSKLTCNERWQR